jgi:hypothetical protein
MKLPLVKDTSGQESLTATAFVVGFTTCCFKLILSGMTVAGITLAPFSGSEFGIAVGALGAIYVLRRQGDKADEKKD